MDREDFPLSRQDGTKQPSKSALVENTNEVSFPRGGASALTPLELKQVANEAANDVLFDNSSKKKSKHENAAGSNRPRKKKRMGKGSAQVEGDDSETESDLQVVEHINFKNLKEGSLVLGQVSAITENDLCISFTDGMSGYVNLTRVSDQLTSILESLDEDMDDSDEVDSSEEEYESEDESKTEALSKSNKKAPRDLPKLESYFSLGQWLRCCIVNNSALTVSKKGKKQRKRIELSIEPSLVNPFSEEDLEKSNSIQCSVKSIEDHGAILDIGIKDHTGFLSKKDYPSFKELLPGSVFLANILKRSGRTVAVKMGPIGKDNKVSHISSIDAVVPGQTVDLLCEDITKGGISGKVFGLLPAFIGKLHLNIYMDDELKSKFPVGSNIKCRIIASVTNKNNEKVLLLSSLPHICSQVSTLHEIEALEAFPIGHIFESSVYKGRDNQYIYVSINEDLIGQIHKSRIGEVQPSDSLVTRVVGYNDVDKCYVLSADPDTLKVKYMRAVDIPAGELVTGCEIKKVSKDGIELSIFSDQFTAFVPPLHISDTRLVYPERKFKIGSKVKGRVLEIDYKGRVLVTLKKTLVNLEDNADIQMVKSMQDAMNISKSGQKTVATVQLFKPSGCIIFFFGGIKGFLPNSEISEVFVKRPEDHLRLGQTVVVKLMEVLQEKSRIIATCKLSIDESNKRKKKIESIIPGRTLLDVVVVEKTKDSVIVETSDSSLRGVIYVGHLSDDKIEQNRAIIKKIRISETLKGLVIDKDARTQIFNLTMKKSLINASKTETALPVSYSDIQSLDLTTPLYGYVKSVSAKGIFVAFHGKLVGLVLPSYAVESRNIDISTRFYLNQSIKCFLLRKDDEHERFLLTLREPSSQKEASNAKNVSIGEIINPVDSSIKKRDDFANGKIVKVKVKNVKKNQLNVILADDVHGRIDISEVYDKFEDINDPTHPLLPYKAGDIIKAIIIGLHDVRGHTFLPISHQVSKSTVYELSLKPSALKKQDSTITVHGINDVKVGDSVIGFVNNYGSNFLWLTVSPILKAKISVFGLPTPKAGNIKSIEDKYPLGSAIKVSVLSIDTEHQFLNVSSKNHLVKDIKDIKVGDVLPSKVTKVAENFVLADLGNGLTGISFITDALDDYSVPLGEVFSAQTKKIIPATVLEVDYDNKKIQLSLRSDNPKSTNIKSHSDLTLGQIVHGFVKRVMDKGIFVRLSRTIEAFVPVSKLSDSYLKEWKKFYRPNQFIIAKVVNCSEDSRILLTLRESEVNGDLKVLKNYSDINTGDIFNGSVKNVTDFGVFVKLDNTANVTGLAHRTEIADTVPDDLSLLFGVGDRVKAVVLKTNPAKKQISLGLKASYFTKSTQQEDTESHQEQPENEEIATVAFDDDMSDVEVNEEDVVKGPKPVELSADGLSLSADFDWTANILDQANYDDGEEDSESEDFMEAKRYRNKKKRHERVEDKTIDINARAPESVDDFERLIMGNPNSSVIWMNYIAFQLQLSEIEKAREICERALKTINFREEAEKMNIWIAMLNLENTFGSDETLEDVFKKACQYMDSYTMHTKLLSIYQMSEKYDKTAKLFKITAKKFGSEKVNIWTLWCEFLLKQQKANEARTILASALKSLPKRNHVEVVRKFAQLEFARGDAEQGRSLFEGLIADAPKRIDIWNVYLDQEIKIGEKKKVEGLFERVVTKKISRKQAKFFFNKWLQFEESQNDAKAAEYVKAKATEYVELHDKVTE